MRCIPHILVKASTSLIGVAILQLIAGCTEATVDVKSRALVAETDKSTEITNSSQPQSAAFSILDVEEKSSGSYRVSWQAVASVKAFDLNISSDTGCVTPVITIKDIPSTASEIQINGDAKYFVCVYAKIEATIVPASNNGLPLARASLDDQGGDSRPSFTSIAWLGSAADGYLNALERTAATAIVGNLVGDGFTLADYAVIASGGTCDASLN